MTTACMFYTIFFLCLVLVNCKGGPSFTRKKIRLHYSASEGSSVRLRCPVTGTNDPLHNRTLVTWSHDSRYIDNTLRNYSRFRLRAGKHLKIVDVGYQDAGVYTCRAYNEFGSVEINITLSIRKSKAQNKEARGEPPRFKIVSKGLLTFKKGETAKLRCHSTGDPDPDVQWFKNDEPYDKNSKRAGVSASGWTLNLRYLTTQDTGIYMCRVSNKLGTINKTFVVRVKVRIPKPRIEESEDERISIQQGKNAIIDCRVESAGRPVFTWRRWGNNLNNFNGTINLSKGSKYVFHDIKTPNVDHNEFGSSLSIVNVSKSDQGKYSCFVKNKYGSDESYKHLFVIVQDHAALTRTSVGPSRQFQATESRTSIILVVGLTISIVLTVVFVIVLICCCRSKRKNMEKKYISNYQPDAVLHAQQGGNDATMALPSHDKEPHEDLLSNVSPSYCLQNNSEKTKCLRDSSTEYRDSSTECRDSSTDNVHALTDGVVSRTSSERTLSIASSREQFIDPKGGTSFTTKCHLTCGEICRHKGQTNSTGKSDPNLRESVV